MVGLLVSLKTTKFGGAKRGEKHVWRCQKGRKACLKWMKRDDTLLGQSFFIFCFTDPPDPIFWKLKK